MFTISLVFLIFGEPGSLNLIFLILLIVPNCRAAWEPETNFFHFRNFQGQTKVRIFYFVPSYGFLKYLGTHRQPQQCTVASGQF